MRPLFRINYATLALLCLAPALAHAGRPLVTDDASILDRGYCQLETWAQDNQRNDEYWAVPHCNLSGNWELIAGVGQLRPPVGNVGGSLRVLQAKTVFRPLTPNGWAIGLTLSDQFNAGASLSGDLSATILLSLSLLDGRMLVHANTGWLRRQAGPNGQTWGLAGEWNVTPRAGLTLEAYGGAHSPSYMQAGARYDLVPGRVTLDAAFGKRIGIHNIERYIAVGLTITGPLLR